MHENTVRARVLVSGRVQGVWYRQSLTEEAHALGVAGWVRNLPGGDVEGVLEGSMEAVEAAIEFMKVGPSRADVRSCEVTWEPSASESGFSIRG